jgi:putative component of toxin-antitoxin plasmid stabilization module
LRYRFTGHGEGQSRRWFDGFDAMAATKVSVALTRLERGNLSNVRPVAEGVLE